MKKLLAVCLVALAGLVAVPLSAAQAEPPAGLEAQSAALPAWLAEAPACGATQSAATPAAFSDPTTEAVVCCTAADRAACTAECSPLIGKTFCIHGCECYCF